MQVNTILRLEKQTEPSRQRRCPRSVKWFVPFLLPILALCSSLLASDSFAVEKKHHVKLEVLLDSRISEAEWEQKIKKWIAFAADQLDEAANVRISVDRMTRLTLTEEDSGTYDDARKREFNDRMKALRQSSDTICLALVVANGSAGCAYIEDANILCIYCKRHDEKAKWVLLHELAHLFGAIHVAPPDSVMNRSTDAWTNETLRFDERNLEIMDLAREDVVAKNVTTFQLKDAAPSYGEPIMQQYLEVMPEQTEADRLSLQYQIAAYHAQTEQHERAKEDWKELYEWCLKAESKRRSEENTSVSVLPRETDFEEGLSTAELAQITGISLFQLGRCSEALKYFLTATEREPTSFDNNYALAGCYFRMGEVESALEVFDRCVEIGSDDGAFWYIYGHVLLEGIPADVWSGERIERAKECMGKAIEYKHEEATAHYVLAVILRYQGLQGESDVHLTKAKELGAHLFRTIQKKGGRFRFGFAAVVKKSVYGLRSKMPNITAHDLKLMYYFVSACFKIAIFLAFLAPYFLIQMQLKQKG